VQSCSQIVITNRTNTQLFTGRMPFRLPSQHRQSTEGKIKCDNYLYGLILAPKMVQGVDLATLNHWHPVCWRNLFLASLPTNFSLCLTGLFFRRVLELRPCQTMSVKGLPWRKLRGLLMRDFRGRMPFLSPNHQSALKERYPCPLLSYDKRSRPAELCNGVCGFRSSMLWVPSHRAVNVMYFAEIA